MWLEWLARDGWLDPPRLALASGCLESADEPAQVASLLVQEGLVTSFQAKNLIAGTEQRLDCGRYRIRKRLGKGGMGEVFAAEPRDRRDIPVAIKILQIDESMPSEDRRRLESRFVREMKAGLDVKHPNVTRTVDFGRDADRLYLVMPRLRGPSLAALIEAKNRRPELKTVVRMAAQVAAGLEAVHQAGLIHRDLKPSNILYDGHKYWKILDLGLAKALGDRLSLTRPGVILGTLDYAAPEQLKDASKVDPAADYYALGCILYHALAGQAPFEGGDAVSKIYRHRMTPPDPLETHRSDLPNVLAEMVNQLLLKNPADRPPGASVRFVLEELLKGRAPILSAMQPTDTPSISADEAQHSTPPADSLVTADSLETIGSESLLAVGSEEQASEVESSAFDDTILFEDEAAPGISPVAASASSLVVVPAPHARRPNSKRSHELETALRMGLIALLILSLAIFSMSIRALWRHLSD
jgi:serine/threonine-protein kinase